MKGYNPFTKPKTETSTTNPAFSLELGTEDKCIKDCKCIKCKKTNK